jgi:hypothetical protein
MTSFVARIHWLPLLFAITVHTVHKAGCVSWQCRKQTRAVWAPSACSDCGSIEPRQCCRTYCSSRICVASSQSVGAGGKANIPRTGPALPSCTSSSDIGWGWLGEVLCCVASLLQVPFRTLPGRTVATGCLSSQCLFLVVIVGFCVVNACFNRHMISHSHLLAKQQ